VRAVCPVETIFYEDDVPAAWSEFTADNARFFTEPLPDAASALGSPGGAAKLGRAGVDTRWSPGIRATPKGGFTARTG
jgi:hypothetical protein